MHELYEISELRRRYGITQKELAKSAGVSQSLIAKIEKGDIDPSYSNARRIFGALDDISNAKGLKARDVMSTHIIPVAAEDSIKKAIQKMKKHGISQLPVLLQKRAIGTISESLILDAIISRRSGDVRVRDIMAGAPPSLSGEASLATVTGVLRFYPMLLVMEGDGIIGVITKADLLSRAFR